MKPLTQIATVLETLPAYLVGYVVSLLVALLSDTILTSLLLGSVALGFATSALIAVAAFFFIYVVIRTINSIANAIGITGQTFTRALVPPPPIPNHSQNPMGSQMTETPSL